MSEMQGTATLLVQAPASLKQQDVVPTKDHALQAEKSLVIRGFPKIPKYWVNGTSVLTNDGGRSMGRIDPVDVNMDSHSRFIAHTFDQLGGTWRPFVTYGINYLMVSPPGLAPHIEDEEYRLGKEILHRDALWFNPGDYLATSFNDGMDDALSFTIAMVVIPRIPANYTLISTTDDEEELSVQVRSTGFRLQYGSLGINVKPAIPLLNVAPVYVVLSCGLGSATLRVGSKATNMRSGTMHLPNNRLSKLKFTLGKSHQGKASASFSMFDFVLYGETMNSSEVHEVIAKLSSSYGAL